MPIEAKVALLVETATSWGSGIIEGVASFAQGKDWVFFLEPRGKYDRLELPTDWRADGVIARITHEKLATQIVAAGIPAVNVSWYRFGEGQIARCTSDEHAAGRLAAQYFLDRGFREFAYCGSPRRPNYIDRFGEAYGSALAQHGHECHRFTPETDRHAKLPWAEQLTVLGAWLSELPKPIALLAFDDVQGRQVTEACQLQGLSVPHDVAVLGGERDDLSSHISRPPLSSIDLSPQRVGYEAAALLARTMIGEDPPAAAVLVPVSQIITRQSTDTLAIEDELVASAIRFIHQNSHERIHVRDILRAVPISRRALEKEFRRYLGRTPAEEIRRTRLDHAKRMLSDTDWTMQKIAVQSGFEHAEVLSRVFRRDVGMTPSQFRAKHQRHGNRATRG